MNGFKFLALSHEHRTRWLFEEAGRDSVCGLIVQDLKRFGVDMRYSVFEGNAQYQPLALRLHSSTSEEHFLRLLRGGKVKAQFRIGVRHGPHAALFHFLHELFHFKQDLDGRLLSRLVKDIEDEAAIESICAAYRLKENGFMLAWRGAMSSLNWRGMAKAYEDVPNVDALKAYCDQRKYGKKRYGDRDVHLTAVRYWKTNISKHQ